MNELVWRPLGGRSRGYSFHQKSDSFNTILWLLPRFPSQAVADQEKCGLHHRKEDYNTSSESTEPEATTSASPD